MPPPPAVPELFSWSPQPWGLVLTCRPLAGAAAHGWTTRQLRLQGSEAACAAEWSRLAAANGVPLQAVRLVSQVHGATIAHARHEDGPTRPTADGVVSRDPAVLLSVRVADCVPILMADPRTGAVAAVHAGWRGTAAGIAAAAVTRLADAFGSNPAHIVAALGPSIGPCCYEVGRDVQDAFRGFGHARGSLADWFLTTNGSLRLDLWAANRDQLVGAGLPSTSVHAARLCTACHPDWFYSYRKEGSAAGRLLGYIRPPGSRGPDGPESGP
jgi:hypothetical protein